VLAQRAVCVGVGGRGEQEEEEEKGEKGAREATDIFFARSEKQHQNAL